MVLNLLGRGGHFVRAAGELDTETLVAGTGVSKDKLGVWRDDGELAQVAHDLALVATPIPGNDHRNLRAAPLVDIVPRFVF